MRVVAMILLCGLLAACTPAPAGDPITPEFDRSNQIIRVKVVYHDTLGEVRAAKAAVTNVSIREVPQQLLGFAGWNYHNTYCEVHLVRPERSLDDRVLTLGHEMLHCVHGSYHP